MVFCETPRFISFAISPGVNTLLALNRNKENRNESTGFLQIMVQKQYHAMEVLH
jgi:hypothetical protein